MTAPLNFALLEKAGVSQKQYASLVGVSRVTVNLWANGNSKPSKKHYRRAAAILSKIETAIARRVLPVEPDKPAERTQRVLDAMVARG